jgi:hypothetical protein
MPDVSSSQTATNASTATLILTADTDGCVAYVHNNSATAIYLGGSDVTAANGMAIDEANGVTEIRLPANSKLYAISFSGTPVLQVLKIGNN